MIFKNILHEHSLIFFKQPYIFQDWSYVYKLTPQHKFVGSKRYAPLSTLPSQLQPVPVSADHVYKASWTNAVSSTSPVPANTNTTTNSQAQIGYVDRLPPNSK